MDVEAQGKPSLPSDGSDEVFTGTIILIEKTRAEALASPLGRPYLGALIFTTAFTIFALSAMLLSMAF